jgi:hypothetical protein
VRDICLNFPGELVAAEYLPLERRQRSTAVYSNAGLC